jgi:26S proteasome regulatory subunit N12
LNWKVGPDNFFHFVREEKTTDDSIPATELAKQTIDYAKELEMIV